MFKKIIIGAPTAAVKNYCIEAWLLNINEFKYPNFEVILADNTQDNGENIFYLSSLPEKLGLKYKLTVVVPHSRKAAGLIERMADSHNACREIAIQEKVEHWLHLETDVFPPDDVIERLLAHRKHISGGLYYRDNGKSRRLMAQRAIFRAHDMAMAHNFEPGDDTWFIDGTVKKIEHIGLGCVLIHNHVFSEVPFRFKKGSDFSVDSWFMADLKRERINVYADTSIICRHQDSAEVWSNLAVDKMVNKN